MTEIKDTDIKLILEDEERLTAELDRIEIHMKLLKDSLWLEELFAETLRDKLKKIKE